MQSYYNVSFLAFPLDQELNCLDGILLILSDSGQLLQAIHVIPTSSIPQHGFVHFLSWPARSTKQSEAAHQATAAHCTDACICRDMSHMTGASDVSTSMLLAASLLT